MLELMGSEDGKTAVIKVSWDEKGMKVYKDGYLADEYGIALMMQKLRVST